MSEHHKIEKIAFTKKKLLLKVDGSEYTFGLDKISKRLADASDAERQKYEISPSGYGIHWPLLDEDLSIDALVGIKHSPAKTKKPVSA